jgi:hypothetical protein
MDVWNRTSGGPERRARRIRTQVLYRRVNERMRRLLSGPDDVPCWFGCECGAPECSEIVELTAAEHDEARVNDARFIVHAGHQKPRGERVVGVHDDVVVVEKHGRDRALALAESSRG